MAAKYKKDGTIDKRYKQSTGCGAVIFLAIIVTAVLAFLL